MFYLGLLLVVIAFVMLWQQIPRYYSKQHKAMKHLQEALALLSELEQEMSADGVLNITMPEDPYYPGRHRTANKSDLKQVIKCVYTNTRAPIIFIRPDEDLLALDQYYRISNADITRLNTEIADARLQNDEPAFVAVGDHYLLKMTAGQRFIFRNHAERRLAVAVVNDWGLTREDIDVYTGTLQESTSEYSRIGRTRGGSESVRVSRGGLEAIIEEYEKTTKSP